VCAFVRGQSLPICTITLRKLLLSPSLLLSSYSPLHLSSATLPPGFTTSVAVPGFTASVAVPGFLCCCSWLRHLLRRLLPPLRSVVALTPLVCCTCPCLICRRAPAALLPWALGLLAVAVCPGHPEEGCPSEDEPCLVFFVEANSGQEGREGGRGGHEIVGRTREGRGGEGKGEGGLEEGLGRASVLLCILLHTVCNRNVVL